MIVGTVCWVSYQEVVMRGAARLGVFEAVALGKPSQRLRGALTRPKITSAGLKNDKDQL